MRANTAYGRAYNSAAEAAYVSKVQTDIDTSFDEIEQTNEADLIGYTAVSTKYADDFVQAAPVEYRVRVQQALAARAAAGTARIRGQAIAEQKDQHTAAVVAGQPARANLALAAAEHLPREDGDAAIAAAVADNQAQIDALVAEHAISAVQAVALQDDFVTALDKGLFAMRTGHVVEGLMNETRVNFAKGDAMLRDILDDPNVSDVDKDAIRKEYDERRTALAEDRGHKYFEQTAELYKRLAADESGAGIESEALRLRNLGGIDDTEYRSVVSKSQENAMKGAAAAVSYARVEMALTGLGTLDPGSADDRKAVNDYVNEGVARLGLAPGTPRWTETMTDVLKRTSILPDQAESWARQSMTSGDPFRAVLGAAFYERQHETNPTAWDYNKDPRAVVFANQLNANMKATGDATIAYNMAFKGVYDTSEDEQKVFAQMYTENKDQLKKNASYLGNAMEEDPAFDPPWSSAGVPDLTGRGKIDLQAQYDNLVGQYFLYGGDIDSARKTAAQKVLSHHGVTTMNGVREVMEMAPERMRPGMTAEIIRADLTATLKAVDPTIDPARVRIQPMGDGATTETRGLTWGLALLNEDGYPDVLLGPDNRPVMYELPQGADFVAAQAAINAAKIEAAAKAKAKLTAGEDVPVVMGGRGLR
jgi:hypothetical protein